jgi:hypothetical protein
MVLSLTACFEDAMRNAYFTRSAHPDQRLPSCAMRKGSHSTRSVWSFSDGRAKSRDFDNGAGGRNFERKKL